jgi:formate--tetrahydrofolate ligase
VQSGPPFNIETVADRLGLAPGHVESFGTRKAKISLEALGQPPRRGKLILISGITPTPAGEGKTTISIGLAEALHKSGRIAAAALRQPSMGPFFGVKGGGTGGGRSALTPAADINLNFTGDFHAITAAHNLLAAVIDNRLHFRTTRLDPARVLWKRVLDVNDRALRHIRIGLDDAGVERRSGFEITAASETMAVLCLAQSYADLRGRLDRMVVGFATDGSPVLAGEMGVTDALLAVLRDALKPNLVQTLAGAPAFVHGGPFANISHGCNSILATRLALGYADYTVTEAGFGFDLGGEKFLHLKCPQAGLAPDVIAIVATVRALKMHGGVPVAGLGTPAPDAVERGLANLAAQLDAAAKFGRPAVVAINRFETDTTDELGIVSDFCASRGVPSAVADVFSHGGDGAAELAEVVAESAKQTAAPLKSLYDPADAPGEKIRKIAVQLYGADGVDFTDTARARLEELHRAGLDHLPICMAKTPKSLSDDPALLGRPKGFRITVREFEIANGAGYLVALTGTMLRMPALPKEPAAGRFRVTDDGEIIAP